MERLSWEVLLPTRGALSFNIFSSVRFTAGLQDLRYRVERGTACDLTEEVRGLLFYAFGYKSEYELECNGLFSAERIKVDAYQQVMLNLHAFMGYLLSHWQEIPALSYRQQRNRNKIKNKIKINKIIKK